MEKRRRLHDSLNAVSRERLGPLDVAADAVIPTYLPDAAAADRHPTYSMRTPMAVPSYASCPPYSDVVQRVLLILRTRCSRVTQEVRGHLRRSQRQIAVCLRFLGRSGT